jgi:hypothetical protein
MRAADAGSDSEEAGHDLNSYTQYPFGVVLGPKHTLVNSRAQGSA